MAAQPQPARQVHAFPTTLTALQARDGAILWQREGWQPFGRARLLLGGDVLVTDALASEIGQSAVTALDPETGKTLWRHDTGTPWGLTERLLTARGGRVFVREEGEVRRLCVLDARNGTTLWRREEREAWYQFSASYVLITDSGTPGMLTVRDGRDGSAVATISLAGTLLALTDDDTAYLATRTYLRPKLVALRVSDANELWRADTAHPDHLLRLGDRLYCGRLTQPRQHAEVTALDARTGERVWRWTSPTHLPGLLKLWGWRMPEVILGALAQARWSIRPAGASGAPASPATAASSRARSSKASGGGRRSSSARCK